MKFHKLILFPFMSLSFMLPSCKGKIFVKVMSYNIQHGINHKSSAREVNLDPVVEIIKKYNPDVLNINEIYNDCTKLPYQYQVKYIAEKLGYYSYFVHADIIDWMDNGDYGGALFSKYPILDSHTYPIPNPLEDPNLEKRAIGKITVYLPNGRDLNLVQSHFGGISTDDKIKDKERQNAIAVLTSVVKNQRNTVFTGDLNLVANKNPDIKYVNQIKEMMDETIDESLPTYDSLNPTEHIDYMFCSHGMKFRNGQVLPDVYADHLPIMCEIEV